MNVILSRMEESIQVWLHKSTGSLSRATEPVVAGIEKLEDRRTFVREMNISRETAYNILNGIMLMSKVDRFLGSRPLSIYYLWYVHKALWTCTTVIRKCFDEDNDYVLKNLHMSTKMVIKEIHYMDVISV